MEDEPLWIEEAHGSHVLMRERAWSDLFGGWLLLSVSVLGGVASGILALVYLADQPDFDMSLRWLLVPAAIPVATAVAVRRNVLYGIVGGVISAGLAFLTVGAWLILMVACFVITFMGECP